MRIKKITLHKLLIIIFVLGLTACSSANKERFYDEVEYDTEEVSQTNSAVYSCASQPLNIVFHGEQAQITWKDKHYHLNHAISASGSFYLGEDVSFWISDNRAEFELNAMDKMSCRLIRIDS